MRMKRWSIDDKNSQVTSPVSTDPDFITKSLIIYILKKGWELSECREWKIFAKPCKTVFSNTSDRELFSMIADHALFAIFFFAFR